MDSSSVGGSASSPTTAVASRVGITLETYILEGMLGFPAATGAFTSLLNQIGLAAKLITSKVRRAGLANILGYTGQTNVQGESVQKLDEEANETLLYVLGRRRHCAAVASEEMEEIHVMSSDPRAKYLVVFDPLDGSSNIDVNISIGTIFGVLRKKENGDRPAGLDDFLVPGAELLAAGYILYGSSTMLVYTTGRGVHGFTLDPTIGTFVLTHPDMRMPERGWTYSVNESYADSFPPYCRRFLHWLQSGEDNAAYRSRYIGSLVADFHRTLLTGGIFMYPPTASYPEGKLRLAYEGNPIAWLAEQAGGLANDGHARILDIEPTTLHQRTPLFVGSRLEMLKLKAFVQQPLKV